MTPDDDWHPIGLSSSIETGSAAGAVLFGRELLVWRDSQGVAHVNEDRCPHRGMKLSFGFVRGDRIACLYHGWQFDHGGSCRYIPAHPDLDVPDTIKVPVYPARERGGMIWTSLSASPPALPEDREPTVALRSVYVDSGIQSALDALGDSRLRPFGSEAPIALERESAALYSLSAGERSLMIGVQQISRARIGLHVVGRLPKQLDASTHRQLLGWILRVRHAMEQVRLPNVTSERA